MVWTVTFNLRQGVTWHEWRPPSPRPMCNSQSWRCSRNITRAVPTLSAKSRRSRHPMRTRQYSDFENPAPYMLRSLSAYESPMFAEASARRSGHPQRRYRQRAYWNRPLSSSSNGARGNISVSTANEDYWKPNRPYLERLVARFIPDASTRTAALENGEVMYAGLDAIPNIDAVRLRDTDGFAVTTDGYGMINSMSLIEFNTKVPPFDNPAMRRAVSQAIGRDFSDREHLLWLWKARNERAFHQLSLPLASTPVHSATMRLLPIPRLRLPRWDAAGILPDADGVRARVTLDLIPYGENWQRSGEYIKQALGDVGIEVDLRYEDVPTWLNRIYADYDYEFNVNYFYQLSDPVLGVHRHYGTDQIRPGTHFVNGARYSNPEVDELLSAGSTEPDPVRRGEIYARMQEILADDMPVTNLFEMEFLTVLQ